MKPYIDGMSIEAPSYITDMPADVYHSHNSISNSGLRLVDRSAAHYKYAPKRESTRAMVIGSALHMAVLEPDEFCKTYIQTLATDRRSKEYQIYSDEYGDNRVLTLRESKHVEGIRDSLWSKFGELLSLPGHNELSGFSIDPETGVVCRHRFDKLTTTGIAIDLKTTLDGRNDAFSRSIQAYSYHVQCAFYQDQFSWITDNELNDFLFLVVESDSPYAAKMYRLNQESIGIGRSIYRKSLNEFAKCKESGIWPAYECDEIEEISIPEWALNQHDKKQIDQFVFVED